ncbi:MAG: NUDIX domain-containing protein [Chloroflexota bacterium]|nr:NUDIX domain-containing protein [Chloroflexota bacterium]
MQQQLPDNAGPPLRPTPVVTCFLLRFDAAEGRAEGEPALLIVQRSQRVGSYHGHWAGISGFIEPGVTPDEQAYTEIREETSLQRDQVRLLKCGAVVEHLDASLNRHFYIHPYLFEALTPTAIKIDWEATAMRWICPAELQDYETIPKLKDAYDSAMNGIENACLSAWPARLCYREETSQ